MGIRKDLLKKVNKHIKDLEKRGIDVNRVTKGKSAEQLAWNKRTYDNFMKQKHNVLVRERDVKKRTNSQGYVLSEKEYKAIRDLEKRMYKKKQNELKKVEKMFGGLSDIEKAFLMGEPVRHLNSNENIELQTSFRKENYIDSYNDNVDLKFFKGFIEDEINDFSWKDVIDKKREEFKEQLTDWANAGVFGFSKKKSYYKETVDGLMAQYDNMSFIQAVQFNQDIKHKLQYVESAAKNIYSVWDEKRLLEDLMKRQDDREFIISR